MVDADELSIAKYREDQGDDSVDFDVSPLEDYSSAALLFLKNGRSSDAIRVTKKLEEYGDSIKDKGKDPIMFYHQAAVFYLQMTSTGDMQRIDKKLGKSEGAGGSLEETVKRVQVQKEEMKIAHQREKDELLGNAAKKVVEKMLPVLDDFDLALGSKAMKDANPKVVEGINLVRKQMYKALEEQGIEQLDVKIGEEFDPAFHEGEGTTSTDQHEDNAIVGVTQAGYMFNGKLLRPAKVIVNQLE